MRSIKSLIAGFLIALFAVSPAFSNSLTSTAPVSGAILNSAPSAVTLSVESPLAEMGSEINVTDPKGSRVDDGALTIDGTNAVVGLLALTEKGVYTVEYSLITDNDVPLTGSYTFTFNAPDKITTPAPTKTKDVQVQSNSNFGTTVFVLLVGLSAIVVAIVLVLYGRKLYNER
jgi:methionine-rich copper-binding protein CopC